MNAHTRLAEQESARLNALATVSKLRVTARDEIERLIAFLDETDGYSTTELEPFLGAAEIAPTYNYFVEKYRIWIERDGDQTHWAQGAGDDREAEPEHDETTNDEEPSLGSTASVNQNLWSAGRNNDLEDEHDGAEPEDEGDGDADDEPSLGWPVMRSVLGEAYCGTGDTSDLELI